MHSSKLLTSDDTGLINISASGSPSSNYIGHPTPLEGSELQKVFTVEHDGDEMFKMLRTAVQWTADSGSGSHLNVNGSRCSSAS